MYIDNLIVWDYAKTDFSDRFDENPLPIGFQVIQVAPANGARSVARDSEVSASLNGAVDFDTVNTETFAVRGEQTGTYDGTYTEASLHFDPATDFKPGEEIVVNLSQGILAADGTSLTPYAWSFRADVSASSAEFTDSGQRLGALDSSGVELGDLDGDGDLDAFVANSGASARPLPDNVWFNDGSGVFADSGQSLGNSVSRRAALGDLDGDGDLDAFVANYGQPNTVWLNDGAGFFVDSGQGLGSYVSRAVALADLDGDGDLDAFVSNWSGSGQTNKIWLNDGAGVFLDSGQSPDTTVGQVALGDLDGDGDLDAFVPHSVHNQGANKVWLNDGTGIFVDSGQNLGRASHVAVDLGDVDGDGDLDAHVANYWGEANEVWLNDGSGTFADSGQRLGSSSSGDVDLGDLDGDGDLDAFASNGEGSHGEFNRVWVNDGLGSFVDSGQALGSALSAGAALGDLDGDGDLDAFVANWVSSPANEVWINRQEPTAEDEMPQPNLDATFLPSISR